MVNYQVTDVRIIETEQGWVVYVNHTPFERKYPLITNAVFKAEPYSQKMAIDTGKQPILTIRFMKEDD